MPVIGSADHDPVGNRIDAAGLDERADTAVVLADEFAGLPAAAWERQRSAGEDIRAGAELAYSECAGDRVGPAVLDESAGQARRVTHEFFAGTIGWDRAGDH